MDRSGLHCSGQLSSFSLLQQAVVASLEKFKDSRIENLYRQCGTMPTRILHTENRGGHITSIIDR